MTDRALVAAVKDGLAQAADPVKASGMRAYMKSAMPYRGVPAPRQDTVFRRVFAEYPLDGFGAWRQTVLALWRDAEYREERYAAIALTGHRRYREHQIPATVPIYEEMVVEGAWWDFVDAVAIHRIGPLVSSYPNDLKPLVRRWSTDENLWRRYTSTICQVAAKGSTDLDLLYDCLGANLADRDFFVRKAIGWALRQYAWTDPNEIQRFCGGAG